MMRRIVKRKEVHEVIINDFNNVVHEFKVYVNQDLKIEVEKVGCCFQSWFFKSKSFANSLLKDRLRLVIHQIKKETATRWAMEV